MANGANKNWIRLLGCLDGFHVENGHWPTRVLLPQECLEDLRDHILGPEAFEVVNQKVPLVQGNAQFIGQDNDGNSYDYGRRGFPPQEA